MPDLTESESQATTLLPRQLRANGRQIVLRALNQGDMAFLRQLYATTRAAEMAQVDWTAEQKNQFLDFQFHAQHTYYNEHFPAASRDIIEVDGEPVGRLYLDLRSAEIRLIDIALLPAVCGQQIGSTILASLLTSAQSRALPVSIHVEQNNPAMRLYQRLGFVQVEEQGIYHLMRWSPPSVQSEHEQSEHVPSEQRNDS